MSDPRKIYWDSSCFICFLNREERLRSHMCDDVLKHAQAGTIELWISTWVIVEVIRPKRPGNAPLPEWAQKVIKTVPESKVVLEDLWRRNQRNNPRQKLTEREINLIQGMFEWPFLKKAEVNDRIALKAVDLCRDFGMKPADAVHGATAILWNCSVIQRWDRDFSKIAHLIQSEEPQRISAQETFGLNEFGPNSEDFASARETNESTQAIAQPASLQGSSGGHSEGQAAPKAEEEAKEPKKEG